MKKLGLIIIGLIMLSLQLTACVDWGGGSSDPAAEKTCAEGVCVEINVSQPIVLNQPSNITITISSTVDKPGLGIKLVASPTNVTFGPETYWQYDAVSNQSQVFQSTVTFTTPGGYFIAAEVFWNSGPLVENFERVVIDNTGATVNPTLPTIPPFRGYPVVKSPPPEVLTAQAAPEITPTPPPPVTGFSPQQWLEICGWTVDRPEALSELRYITGGLDIKEAAVIGEQVNGTLGIGFKDEANRDVTIQTQIGLCTLGQGWTTDAIHEWNAELHSGTPYEAPISLHFTETGDIPIFIVVLDRQNNRISGIGRLIYVKSKE